MCWILLTPRLFFGEIIPEPLIEEFERVGEADFSYETEAGRFRVNAFRQRGAVSIVMRFIPFEIPKFEELGLPEVIRTLAFEERGIVLITGTTGSGKSTTLASMIDMVNHAMPKHVVTIEDPIEFLHRDDKSIINQREVGTDTASFARALRRVLRQDPDVILIGEIRDAESAQMALSAAETGHLVLSTLHTVDATETINRLIDLFPPHERNQVRTMMAGTLKGIVGQRLIRTQRRRQDARLRGDGHHGTHPGTSSWTRPRPARSSRPSPRANTTACRPSTRPCSNWSKRTKSTTRKPSGSPAAHKTSS